MRILGIETSTHCGSVAILEDERILGELFLNNGPTHSEKLLPMIDLLLREIGVDKRELGGISVVSGPGSFTALRIGISSAKGLALSLGIPVVGVSSLEVLALNLLFTPFVICSIMDAKKSELFAAFFTSSSGRLSRSSDDMLVSPHDLIGMIRRKTVFVGNGAMVYEEFLRDALGELSVFCPSSFNSPRASNCALLGAQRLKKGSKEDLSTLAPQYLGQMLKFSRRGDKMKESELIESLIEGDEEFKRLYFEHRKLDGMVKDLEERGSLSFDEELEVKKLKKIKLSLKDEMERRIKKLKQSS
jgi:tRNA threonylcarbamoyladenosine biosynthesis protein TsaB